MITCGNDVHFVLVELSNLGIETGSFFPCHIDSSLTFYFRPDSIVCIDACFKPKHNKQRRDPQRSHPASVFIPEGLAQEMESHVEAIRPPLTKTRKKTPTVPLDEDDGFEDPALRVPRSVLNTCESSFIAADELREKASKDFFDATGLMAMLCRHDRVLWVVNMTSPGEKQHYVLLLIETLFQHLPHWWIIGLLYDIGCQLHHSCIKWDFLGRYLDRILFAISVFHAFGHGWPCQCIYHPRKCVGFGLSDGEGCERFWYSISFLILYLRVAGVSNL